MKYINNFIQAIFGTSKNSQDEILEFIRNKKNIEKAVDGSMQKRIDLTNRATR